MHTGWFKLTCVGLLAAAFFVLTDARLGLGPRFGDLGQENPIDAMHAAWPGTVVGVACSGLVVLAGLWLLTRRRY